MELTLNPHVTPFNLEHTLECGQLFRWEKIDDWWYGVAEGVAFKVQQENVVLSFDGVSRGFVHKYFRLDDNLPFIISRISRDALMRQAVQTFPGLRLVRQNPWECLISYICATCKNIPAIKNMILRLSTRFGEKIAIGNRGFYTFPEPHRLAAATLEALRRCGLGYRAKPVREAAKLVESQKLDFDRLEEASYEEARTTLMRLPGVGCKVADCVLLFSLEKLDAFPVDVWMKRAILKHYGERFEERFMTTICGETSLSRKQYENMSSFGRGYFGEYAGYAQEYLFAFARRQKESEI